MHLFTEKSTFRIRKEYGSLTKKDTVTLQQNVRFTSDTEKRYNNKEKGERQPKKDMEGCQKVTLQNLTSYVVCRI